MSNELDPERGAAVFWRFARRPTAGFQLAVSVTAILIAAYSAYLSSQSLRHLSRQLEITDRAWLKVDIRITGPFQSGAENHSLPFDVIMKNVGRTVATDIAVDAILFPVAAGDSDSVFNEPPRRQSEICEQQRGDRRRAGNDFVIFPDDAQARHVSAGLDIAESKRNAMKTTPGNPPLKYTNVVAMIVGCVTYRYNASNSPHSTRFGYQLVRSLAEGQPPQYSIALETIADLPVHLMALSPFFNLFTAD